MGLGKENKNKDSDKMLINCNALSVTQDQKPKDVRTRKKTGKRLCDKVSELLLKKKNLVRQKAMNLKNVKVTWQGRKWLLVRKVALWVIFSLFANFHDVILCFQFLKRTKKKKKAVQENTPWEQSQAHRCFA